MMNNYWKRQLLSSYFVMLPVLAWTQPGASLPDSIIRALRAPLDTHSINVLNTFAWNLAVASKFTQADSILRLTERRAHQLNYPHGLERAYYSWAQVYYFQDKHDTTLFYLDRSRKLAEQHHLPSKTQQDILSLLGHTHYCLHNYATALSSFLKSIQIIEQYGLTHRVTPSYVGVGNVLRVMGRTSEALLYFKKALIVSRRETNKRYMALALTHMGVFVSLLGKDHSAEALAYFKQALPIAQQVNSRKIWADDLTCTGQMYLNLGNSAKALAYLNQAGKICASDGFPDQLGANCYVLGQTYQTLKQYTLAESYLKQSIQLARQIHDADALRTRTQTLAQFYAETRQYRQAYYYQQAMTAIKDSLFSIESARHAHELVTRYETEKKEQQLRLLSEKHQRASIERNALLIGGFLLLLLSLAVAAWLLNRARLRRLEEGQMLRKQIAHDLHDEVGSTLSSISLLSDMTNTLLTQKSYGSETAESIQPLVRKIYTDARQILESVDEIIWTINPGNDSLHRIALRLREYAQPLMLAKNIELHFSLDPLLDHLLVSMKTRRHLYLFGKEAINNLVKYSRATQAVVRFTYSKERLSVLIEDNGQGFDPVQPTSRTGQQSMRQRAQAMGGTLTVRSTPGQGTALELVAVAL